MKDGKQMSKNPFIKNPYIESAIRWEIEQAKARRDRCTDWWEKQFYDMYPDDPRRAEVEMSRAVGGL